MVQQSAAIEALGAGVPLISEDSETNRRIFYKGAILTKFNEKDITYAIKEVIIKNEILKKEINDLKIEYSEKWHSLHFNKLINILRETND